MGLNPDCGIFQIKITERQDKIEWIAGNSKDNNIFSANNLPEELKTNGLKILLDLRKPEPENNELGICTTMGPGYTWVFVTKAKKRIKTRHNEPAAGQCGGNPEVGVAPNKVCIV